MVSQMIGRSASERCIAISISIMWKVSDGNVCNFLKIKKKLYPELIRWAEYAMQLKPNGERAKNFQKDIQIWGGKK